MIRKSAARLLKSGKKLTHEYFSDNEWIKLVKDRLVDENGIDLGSIESFTNGDEMPYIEGWRVWS
jgi:hypothetical protein